MTEREILLAFLVQPGDTVRIIKSDPKWHDWVSPEMEGYKNQTLTVRSIFTYSIPPNETAFSLDNGFIYPLSCLELVSTNDS